MLTRLAQLLTFLSLLWTIGCGTSAPPDEAKAAGKSVLDFPPSTLDHFTAMDGIVDTSSGRLDRPKLDEQAIIGRNTWMMWTGGNEAFWDWLSRHGYGTLDFLQLLDSHLRADRFTRNGLISEPGMRPPTAAETAASHGIRFDRPADPTVPQPDPKVYGLSSGIVGLRLFPNPGFQGAAAARWNSDRYYDDAIYAADPRTIRPYRVGMSCAFCHAGPHPLNPPTNPDAPEWSNLSGTVGSQYLRIRGIFGNTLTQDNFLYHALNIQLPGTIDTSLVAADNINNASTMNAIFGVPERIARALHNPTETLETSTRSYPGIWTHEQSEVWNTNPRPVPRILADGSDSAGAFVALARVYLNIGTYHQEWIRLHNPLLGLRKQRPFKLADCDQHSVYWSATKSRVEPILAYFLQSTPPMRLRDAPDGMRQGGLPGTGLPWDPSLAAGRKVFARGCIACHSSIQPGDQETLEAKLAPAGSEAPRRSLRLTMDDLWRLTEGDGELPEPYLAWAMAAVEQQEFWEHNFLSTDTRLPVTMIGTNAARALGSNATQDHVWNDFSSQTYKQLESAGRIAYRDPFTGEKRSFLPPNGGPGYYRPPSLISVWATAPFLHNNAVGEFNNDPSVAGRLAAYDDAIRKFLWPEKRFVSSGGDDEDAMRSNLGTVGRTDAESSLVFRGYQIPDLFAGFTGWPSWLIRSMPWTPTLMFVLIGACLMGPIDLIREFIRRRVPRFDATVERFMPLATFLVFALTLAWLGVVWRFAAILQGVESASHWHIPYLRLETALFPILFFATSALFLRGWWRAVWQRRATRWLSAICFLAAIVFTTGFAQSLSGRGDDVVVGPFPAGMPVNLIANMDPEAPVLARGRAITALLEYFARWHRAPSDQKPGLTEFEQRVAPGLMAISKCPDFVMNRGHDFEFMRGFSDEEKESLIVFLKTL